MEHMMTMPMNLHPQYITNDNGEKMSVILSMQEFENILEDFEDLAMVAERKDEKLTSHQDVLKELKQDGVIDLRYRTYF
jgi:hypothetical protein